VTTSGVYRISGADLREAFVCDSFASDRLQLIRPGTVGEAVMRVKRSQKNRLMIETYNLLGDPAARLALPSHEIKFKIKQRRDFLEIKGRLVDVSFDGQVIIDWQDAQGAPIQSQQMELHRGSFKLRIDLDPDQEIGKAQAYAWNEEQNIDAMGGIVFETQVAAMEAPRRAINTESGRQSRP